MIQKVGDILNIYICSYLQNNAPKNKGENMENNKSYYVKNMLSGLVTVVVARNRYLAIKKGIDYFGVKQVRFLSR